MMTKYTRYQCESMHLVFSNRSKSLISSRQLNILKTLSKTFLPTNNNDDGDHGNADCKHNRNANENIHYLMPTEFLCPNHVYHATCHNVLPHPRKISNKTKTISKKSKNRRKKDTKRNNNRRNEEILWTNTCRYHFINAFELDFVMYERHTKLPNYFM